ncbi:MAG: carboxypeptidase regulatory-like domain-containing protein [Candidatus Hydrogenedentota bacterium]
MKPFTFTRRWIVLGAAIASLAACERTDVSGIVMDIQGETLPGVAVRVESTPGSAVTTARGEYRVAAPPGPIELLFDKTGYTPGRLELTAENGVVTEAAQVRLWALPNHAGVFFYEDFSYVPCDPAEAKRYFFGSGELTQAVQRGNVTRTKNTTPLIVCYRTPRYDARLARLEALDAKIAANDAHTVAVWKPAETVGAELRPIDEAEGLLLALSIDKPLVPGVYAVHWGALEGRLSLETRAFLFEVEGEIAEAAPAESGPSTDDSPPTKPAGGPQDE